MVSKTFMAPPGKVHSSAFTRKFVVQSTDFSRLVELVTKNPGTKVGTLNDELPPKVRTTSLQFKVAGAGYFTPAVCGCQPSPWARARAIGGRKSRSAWCTLESGGRWKYQIRRTVRLLWQPREGLHP